jgi:hypothetical protein
MKNKIKIVINVVIGLVVVIILIAVAKFMGLFGKKNDKPSNKYIILDEDGNTITDWNPMPLATELYDVMSGILDPTYDKEVAWAKLANLDSDKKVEIVYNVFNTEYGAGQTLTQWITGEYGNLFHESNRDDALKRLTDLGLN